MPATLLWCGSDGCPVVSLRAWNGIARSLPGQCATPTFLAQGAEPSCGDPWPEQDGQLETLGAGPEEMACLGQDRTKRRSSGTTQRKPCMVVIIAGSRSITDLAHLEQAVQNVGWLASIQLVISGGATGVDTLAARFARTHGLPLEIIRAAWSNISVPGAVVRRNARGRYNAAAGMQRNMGETSLCRTTRL